MHVSEVQIVARVGRHAKRMLLQEAADRGVEASALLRAILERHFADVGGEVLGYVTGSVAVAQIERCAHVELVIPRRQVSPRSPARP